MNISELAKKTNVSKKTIFCYIREGALSIPRQSPDNSGDFAEETIEQIQLIRSLQEKYLLPLTEITKIIKRQKKVPSIDKTQSMSHLENSAPVAQNNTEFIKGRNDFLKVTGLSGKWLDKMQEWQIITPEKSSDQLTYSAEDVIIGKLIVEMDRLGLGPKDGYFPEDLRLYSHFVKDFILPNHIKYLKENAHLLKSQDFRESGVRMIEAIGRFIYYLYLKTIKQEVNQVLNDIA